MKYLIALLFVSIQTIILAQQPGMDPTVTEIYKQLETVTPGNGTSAPSDAIVLFDGEDLSKWEKAPFSSPSNMKGIERILEKYDPGIESTPASWKIIENALEVVPGSGGISTKQSFGSVQLHLEFKTPKMPDDKKGQAGGNSGVFFMGLYEVQVLNSYQNPTYNNGQAASIYKQFPPLVNASLPPEKWQSYDIIFMSPIFSDSGELVRPAKVTVFHNGVLVQNGVELLGPTCYIGLPYYVQHSEKLPLMLQDHNDPMQFRNIWIREL